MVSVDVSLFEILLFFLLGVTEPTDLEPLPVDTAVRYLPDDCELMGFADLRGAGQGVEALIDRWRAHPVLLDIPDVAGALDYLAETYRVADTRTVEALGVSAFERLTAASFCVEVKRDDSGWPQPRYIAVLQGDFEATVAAGLAAEMGLTLSPTDGTYRDAYGSVVVYAPEDGVLLVGSSSFVDPIRATGWTAPTPAPGTLSARFAALAPDGARYFLGADPGIAMSLLFIGLSSASVTDLVAGMERGLVMGTDHTVTIEVQARHPMAYTDWELILHGIAGWTQILPVMFGSSTNLLLGFVQPGDGAWFSEQEQILAAHRDELLAILRETGALTPPEANLSSNPATSTVTLTLEHTEGFVLLTRNFLAASYLAAVGQLPATVESISAIPGWWRARIGTGLP